MNIFVLSTGRCGSTTFVRACEHIDNFSAGHESQAGKLRNRFKYPDNHIESDNRLSWFLGHLDREYGKDAFYVHLKRDREATAESFSRRYDKGIIEAYRKKIIHGADNSLEVDPIDVCRHYWDTVNSNIELFLRDKSSLEFWLESAEKDFQEFWERIGAVGDLSACLEEWSRKYNASGSEEEEFEPPLPVRIVRKAVRVVQKFPVFLRKA